MQTGSGLATDLSNVACSGCWTEYHKATTAAHESNNPPTLPTPLAGYPHMQRPQGVEGTWLTKTWINTKSTRLCHNRHNQRSFEHAESSKCVVENPCMDTHDTAYGDASLIYLNLQDELEEHFISGNLLPSRSPRHAKTRCC